MFRKELGPHIFAQALPRPGLSLKAGLGCLKINNLAGELLSSVHFEGHVDSPISTGAKHTLRYDIALLEALENHINKSGPLLKTGP